MFPGFQDEKLINSKELEKQKDRLVLKAICKIHQLIEEKREKLSEKERLAQN